MPPGVASPDEVETRFGALRFFDEVPDQASTEKIYDNLDYQRAVQAYLLVEVDKLFDKGAPIGEDAVPN